MGATGFENGIMGFPHTAKGMKEAYSNLREQESYSYGNDSYNGTITTTSGVRLSPLAEDHKNLSISDFDNNSELVSKINDRIVKDGQYGAPYPEKWGYCEALPIYGHDKITTKIIEKPVTITVDIPSEVVARDNFGNRSIRNWLNDNIRSLSRKKAYKGILPSMPKEGEMNVTIDKEDIAEKPVMKSKLKNTPGKQVTKYFIINLDHPMIPSWDKGYNTLSEAKNNLPVTNHEDAFPRKYTITGITGREEGIGLAVNEYKGYETKNTSVTVTFTATCTLTTINKDMTGWFFYGWAAC